MAYTVLRLRSHRLDVLREGEATRKSKIINRMKFLKDSKRWLPGVIISLIFIVILYHTVDWNSLATALKAMDLRFLALNGVLYYAMIGARAMASRTLLENRPSFRDSFVVMMQGWLLNDILPFRLGELGRAYLLGRKTGLGTLNSLPAIIIERFYDLAFAAIVLIATLPFVLKDVGWVRYVSFWTLGLVTVSLFSLHLMARFRIPIKAWIDRAVQRVVFIEKHLLPQIDSFLDGLAVLTNTRLFVTSLLWMALVWGLAVMGEYVLLQGLLRGAPLLYSTFAVGASAFAGVIPSAPSGLGVYEAAVVGALAILSVDSGIALALAVIHHIAHFVYSGIVGLYGFSRDSIGLMEMYDRLTKKEARS
jgi:uncharacterized protein (TIRG00374 family)